MPATDFAKIGTLTFENPDTEKFPSLKLARQAGRTGGTMPAVFNAANEVAVARFVKEEIKFLQIFETVERTMNAHRAVAHAPLDAIIEADLWARKEAERAV